MGTSQEPLRTSQDQLIPSEVRQGAGGGCRVEGCSPNIEFNGSGFTGGFGFGGNAYNENPSGIYASAGGTGIGPEGTKSGETCGLGTGGAFDSITGERIGSGSPTGGSC